MGIGVLIIDRQRPIGCFLRFRCRVIGRHVPIDLIDVVVRQAVVHQAVVRVDLDGLMEIIEAFGKSVFCKFVRVISAFEIKLIGFGIPGRTLRQILLILCRKLRPQPLRNLPGNVVLHGEQVAHFSAILLAPNLVAVADVVELDRNRNVVAPLSDAAGEHGLYAE